jgi:Zn-dependent protease with chaperone function
MAYTLAVSRQAHWYNPAWLFVNGFHRVFLRITLGASRLQEILADRYAALAYGAQNFIDGLTHIVRQTLTFKSQVSREIKVAAGHIRGLENLYCLAPVQGQSLRTLQTDIEREMRRPTAAYDSHPSMQDRITLVRQLEAAGVVEDNQEPVWDLLPNAEALQQEMTAHVQRNVQRQAQIAQAVRRQRGY